MCTLLNNFLYFLCTTCTETRFLRHTSFISSSIPLCLFHMKYSRVNNKNQIWDQLNWFKYFKIGLQQNVDHLTNLCVGSKFFPCVAVCTKKCNLIIIQLPFLPLNSPLFISNQFA